MLPAPSRFRPGPALYGMLTGILYVILHYSYAIMSAMASQITDVSVVCSIVCSGVDQRKHQSTASLTFVRGIYRWPVDSPHKGPVTWKMFPVDKNVSVADGVFLGTSAQAENLELLKRMHISHLLNVAGLPAGIRHTRASRFKDIPVTYEELPIDDVD